MKSSLRTAFAFLSAAVLVGGGIFFTTCRVHAAPKEVERPKIVGVAHIALRTDDLEASRKFYSGDLGFDEPFNLLKATEPNAVPVTFFKVNDHQYIEVSPTLKDPQEDRLWHIAFETTDAEQLREYLASKGVTVPDKLPPRRDHNKGFTITDPEGHSVEFVQYVDGSLQSDDFGKFVPEARISRRIIHVGFIVKDRAAEDRLYKDILGFKSIWYGGMKDDVADWVDMRVPDGTDWLEYMMNVKKPDDVHTRGVMHHMALGVPDIQAGYKTAVANGYKSDEKPKIGRDGKWQYNMYDPGFTRVELMEPKPVQTPCCSPMLQ